MPDIGQDQDLGLSAGYRNEIVEGESQRVDIRVVAVVDQFAAADALLEFHAHCDALQGGQRNENGLPVEPQNVIQCDGFGGIFPRSTVGKRQCAEIVALGCDTRQLTVSV